MSGWLDRAPVSRLGGAPRALRSWRRLGTSARSAPSSPRLPSFAKVTDRPCPVGSRLDWSRVGVRRRCRPRRAPPSRRRSTHSPRRGGSRRTGRRRIRPPRTDPTGRSRSLGGRSAAPRPPWRATVPGRPTGQTLVLTRGRTGTPLLRTSVRPCATRCIHAERPCRPPVHDLDRAPARRSRKARSG